MSSFTVPLPGFTEPSIGLSPHVLQQVLEGSQAPQSARKDCSSSSHDPQTASESTLNPNPLLPRIVYELDTTSNKVQPQLRLRTYDDSIVSVAPVDASTSTLADDLPSEECRHKSIGEPSQTAAAYSLTPVENDVAVVSTSGPQPQEIVIPLTSDSIFVQTLIHAHQSLSERLTALCNEFYADLDTLAREISEAARPMSQTTTFHAHSSRSNAVTVRVRAPTGILSVVSNRSDLYVWREVLQLYMDAEIFESSHEESRGERAVTDAEERLAAFMQQLTLRGLSTGRRMKFKQSKHAMQIFLKLNHSILNLCKVSQRFEFRDYKLIFASSFSMPLQKQHAKFSRSTLNAPRFLSLRRYLPRSHILRQL